MCACRGRDQAGSWLPQAPCPKMGFSQAAAHAHRVPKDLRIAPLVTGPFLCCLPDEHTLARRRKLASAMPRDEPFVLFSRRVSPEYLFRIIEMCGSAGYYPPIRDELRH